MADAIADNGGDDVIDQARAANEVAVEKCEALTAASQKECKDDADAALDQAKQTAKMSR